ncbi:MAG TPA: GNAT family N-acetyltransferase [Pyrinomonadaceae bacterium]|nr:GNAT family N-acetyltransferase [Pyrinomonadaceae bacterium]
MSNKALNISLRAAGPEDEAFLYEVYQSTRAEEMIAWGWDKHQQEFFLKMQLRARDQSYLMYYTGIDDSIILFENVRAGRLITSRTDEEIRLVDISLLPEFRGAGVGTSLIRDLLAEADRTRRIVRLQVERANTKARRLYERMGFQVTSENQTHFQMERKQNVD